MPNSTLELAQLNKVFRAVHDRVCPNCGGAMARPYSYRNPAETFCTNEACNFVITDKEMLALAEQTIPEWGAKLVETFNRWREARR